MLNTSRTVATLLAGLLVTAACSSSKQTVPTSSTPAKTPAANTTASAPAANPAPTTPPPSKKGTGINVANIDKSVEPCGDFFRHANGNWIKNNPVPAAEVRWGSFNELSDR